MRAASLIASLAVAAGALGSTGCAALFRESRPKIRIESDPPGAAASVKEKASSTPGELEIPRKGLSEIRVTKAGYEEHNGVVRKHVNGLWLTADLATCIIPVLICIPLLVDAISGAWVDVDPIYRAHLVPLGLASYGPATQDHAATLQPAAPTPPPPPPVATASAGSWMSDSERMASARAAYQEGVELQAKPSYSEALARFQYAQRLVDAPTHLLHIAQCLASTGKLVEAQESYETLTHRELQGNAPAPFREAVEVGRRELAVLQPRIPTLRIEVKPAPSTLRNLVLQLNARPIPNDVIGIARPVNPGAYRITATAWGIQPSKPVEITLEESVAKTVEIKLGTINAR